MENVRIRALAYPQLKEELAARDLSNVGSYTELLARLLEHTESAAQLKNGELSEVPPLVFLAAECLRRADAVAPSRGDAFPPTNRLRESCRGLERAAVFDFVCRKGAGASSALKQSMYTAVWGLLGDELDMTGCAMRGDLDPEFVDVAVSHKVTTVRLPWNPKLSCGGVGRLLESSRHLRELSLAFSGVGPDQMALFSGALAKATTLEILDLSGNKLGRSGSAVLASALGANTVLTDVNLAFNSMGIEGARALAPALRDHPSIVGLNLRGNGIGLAGATALAPALGRMACLRRLNIADNNIDRKGAATIAVNVKIPMSELLRAFGV